MVYYPQLTVVEAHAFQPIQWRVGLDETIEATKYFARTGSGEEPFLPPLGAIRVENAFMGGGVYKDVMVHGYAKFMWVWNNSGSDIARGVPMVRRVDQAVSNITTGGTNYATKAGTWTADKEFGALMQVLDDAGGAGAAPEGEWAVVWKNTADQLFFQPDLTTALAANDDLQLIYNAHVLAAGSGAKMCDFRGVPVASGGIANGYMGWACIEADIVAVKVVAAGTAITTHEGLIAGTAIFTNGSSAADEVVLAYALSSQTTDTVARLLMVSMRANPALAASA